MKTLLAAAVIGAAAMTAAPAQADYPEGPIKVIVPFATGGMSDSTARLFQKAFQDHELLPQPLTVVNMGGGGATIGSRAAMESEPDGETIMLIHLALLSANALGISDYGAEAFEPIAQTGSSCLILATQNDKPYQTLEDLFEAARAKPDEITEAVNLGAVVHIASLILAEPAGVSFRYVQSGGGAKRIQDLIGGHVETAMFSTAEFKSFKELGIRGLALLADERHPDFPDIPTAREQGYDVTFCVDNWWFAPAGTPPEHVAVLADAFEAAMATDDIKNAFAERTIDPTFLRGDALAQHIQEVKAGIDQAAEKAQ
jgi:tripartite-type tricarboxylate transporter receptor subunit TctC